MDALTNGVTIKIGSNSYHSMADFGLAIGNNNYIEAPEYETNYVSIPGRNGVLDLSEAIAGRVIYKTRKISIEFGGMGDEMSWDGVISNLRNLFHGKVVQLIFDNDPTYYWTGRAEINDFDRFRNLGTFKFEIPEADPFKYSIDIVPGLADLNVTYYTYNRKIDTPVTGMPVNPTFIVSDLTNLGTSGRLEVSKWEGNSYSDGTKLLTKNITADGTYTFSDLWINPGEWLTLRINYNGSSGSGTASIVYRQVSL